MEEITDIEAATTAAAITKIIEVGAVITIAATGVEEAYISALRRATDIAT
jgi:alcohol dehydrogenase YqhD (iron-dependent ADH family)